MDRLKKVARSAPAICHMCPCPQSEPATGCQKKLHPAHGMEQIRDTGYWYCPEHDRGR